jgi:uncharacterized protein (TIGR03435 family)
MRHLRIDVFTTAGAATLLCIFLIPSYSLAPIPPAPILESTPQDSGLSPKEKSLAFDAASIKPYSGGGGGSRSGAGASQPKAGGGSGSGGLLRFTPGRVATAPMGVTARKMILEGFHLTQYQLSGGPDWIDSDRFDLEAAAEGANENQLRQMLQTLLAERFKLVIRRETREMPLYHLVVAKRGTKLHEWKEGDPMPRFGSDNLLKFENHGTPQHLADLLSGLRAVGRPVVDKTGLTGAYVFYVAWDPREDFLPAMQEQLGLTLEPHKGVVDCIAIDRIEKPEGN